MGKELVDIKRVFTNIIIKVNVTIIFLINTRRYSAENYDKIAEMKAFLREYLITCEAIKNSCIKIDIIVKIIKEQ